MPKHANAHGTSIHFSKLQGFLDYANTVLSPDAFENTYIVDYIFDAGDPLLPQIGLEIATHPEYFGNAIEEVKVIVKNIPLNDIFVMGADKSSVKITHNSIAYVKFKDLDFIEELEQNKNKTLTVFARLNLNEFRNVRSLQCFIDDYEFEDSINQSKYDF